MEDYDRKDARIYWYACVVIHKKCLFNMRFNCQFDSLLGVYHCLRRLDTQRIDLSAKVHHYRKIGFVLIRGMHCSKHYVKK